MTLKENTISNLFTLYILQNTGQQGSKLLQNFENREYQHRFLKGDATK